MRRKVLLPVFVGMTVMTIICGTAGAEDETIVGQYTSFALGNKGYVVSSELSDSAMSLIMTLNEDGTCIADYGFGDPDEFSWESENSKITFSLDGSTTNGTYEDGVLIFKVSPDSSIYLAKDGVDTTSYDMITTEEGLTKMNEELAAKAEATKKESIEKYALKNDDSHIIFEQNNNVLCCEFDNESNLIDYKCYNAYDSEEIAAEYKVLYEDSGFFEGVEQDGVYVILNYPTNGYTRSSIENLYGNYILDTE